MLMLTEMICYLQVFRKSRKPIEAFLSGGLAPYPTQNFHRHKDKEGLLRKSWLSPRGQAQRNLRVA